MFSQQKHQQFRLPPQTHRELLGNARPPLNTKTFPFFLRAEMRPMRRVSEWREPEKEKWRKCLRKCIFRLNGEGDDVGTKVPHTSSSLPLDMRKRFPCSKGCMDSHSGASTCQSRNGPPDCQSGPKTFANRHLQKELYALRASRWHPHSKEVYVVSVILLDTLAFIHTPSNKFVSVSVSVSNRPFGTNHFCFEIV